MIVRIRDDRLELITQPDHAHLAGAIMERCEPLQSRPRRASILHAIAEHDNGWEEVDASPMVDARSGDILDFMHAPGQVRQGVWPRAIGRLREDPYAAALVAQHALTAYDRYRGDPEWSAFFSGMERARDEALRAGGSERPAMLEDYRFVRLGDLISLAFCTGTTEHLQYGGWSVRLSGPRVIVTPDAFGGSEVPIEIAARTIPRVPYPSDAAVSMALGQATRTTLTGIVTAS